MVKNRLPRRHGEMRESLACAQCCLPSFSQPSWRQRSRPNSRSPVSIPTSRKHLHDNTFRAAWKASWRAPELVNFALDADGQPAALEMMGARFSRKSKD